MAKLINPLFSRSASGAIAGSLLYTTRNGIATVRSALQFGGARRLRPTLKPTQPQLAQRAAYAAACAWWASLTDQQRLAYQPAATARRISLFAAAISDYLTTQEEQDMLDQTARDNLALIAIRAMLATDIASAQMIAGYQWRLATDEWATDSTDAALVTGGIPYYTNGSDAGGGTALIPTMTSNTAPSGIFTRSEASAAGYEAWKAADANAGTFWMTVAFGIGWIAYAFAAPTAVRRYVITARADYTPSAPRDWVFSGLNPISGEWEPLDTQTNQTWAAGEVREYPLPTNATYAAYRLTVSAVQAANNQVQIANLQFIAPNPSVPTEMVLISPATTVAAAPTTLAMYALYRDDDGASVLGTDLTVDLSRDDGATWLPATIDTMAQYDATYQLIRATANAAAAPAGTALRVRIGTPTAKLQRIAAPAIYSQ